MPNRDGDRSRGKAAEQNMASGIGSLCPRSIDDRKIGDHSIMDVASERHNAGLVEQNRLILLPARQFELKPFGGGEGIDVMPNPIMVHEGHACADGYRGNERVELYILHSPA